MVQRQVRLQPALRPPENSPREHGRALVDHRRKQRVQQFLEAEPVTRHHGPAARQQKPEQRLVQPAVCFSAFTRASDDLGTSPTQVVQLVRTAWTGSTRMSRRLTRPRCAPFHRHELAPVHRVSLRTMRPVLCSEARFSNSRLPNLLEELAGRMSCHCAPRLGTPVLRLVPRTQSCRTGRSKPPNPKLMG